MAKVFYQTGEEVKLKDNVKYISGARRHNGVVEEIVETDLNPLKIKHAYLPRAIAIPINQVTFISRGE